MADPDEPWDPEAPVDLPVDGVLDLHPFSPRDLRTLVPDYLRACRDAGIRDVRIVHGKGTGAVRRSVQALLARDPLVLDFATAEPQDGGWGATVVRLR
jgi:DNA-nicking Smr family endonuclease